MRIRTRLSIGFFVVVAISLFLGGFGLFLDLLLVSFSDDILEISQIRTNISSILNAHFIWRHNLSETVYTGVPFTESLDSETCSLGRWLNSDSVRNIEDAEVLELLSQIIEPHHILHNRAGEVLTLIDAGNAEEGGRIFRNEIMPATLEVISKLEAMETRYDVLLNDKINEIHDIGIICRSLIIVFMIVSFIISASLALIITNSIVKPVKTLANVISVLANGDFTQYAKINSKDEIGDLSKDFNTTLEKIKNMILVIKSQSNVLQEIGSDLASNMNQTAAAVNQINANVQSIKGRVLNQSASVSETNATMEQLAANINRLNSHVEDQSSNISEASSAIEQMVANTNSVANTLVNNAANVKNLKEASEIGRSGLQEVVTDIQEIARESEGLLEINSVMQNIASQTNLLSMNAAIEAAHAGEAGKGFAVVADEIRKLAENSGKQSKTIGVILKKIKEAIDKISHSTDNVLNKFEAIDSSVNVVSVQEDNIRNAMEEQGVGSKQVLEGVGNINEITGKVKSGTIEMSQGAQEVIRESGNLEKTTQEITYSMNEMAAGAEQINVAVNAVNDISIKNRDAIDMLMQEVSRFKV